MPEALLLILYLVVLVGFTTFHRAFRFEGFPAFTAPVLLLLKFLAGSTLAWMYTQFYTDRATADVFKLFDDSRHLYEAIDQHPQDFWRMLTGLDADAPYYDRYYLKMNNWFPSYEVNQGLYYDTRTLIRLNAFIRLFSMGYYPIHVLCWSLFSLLGTRYLYSIFLSKSGLNKWLILTVVIGLPSVLAWGSGVLKEGVVLFFTGLFLDRFFRMQESKNRWRLIPGFLLAILGFMLMKGYILLALVPGCLAWVLTEYFQKFEIRKTYLGVLVFSALMALNIQYLVPSINFMETLSVKQQALLRLAYYTDSGSVIFVNPLDPNWISFLRNWPEALLNASFRPWVTEASNALQWIAALENLCLALVVLASVIFYERQAQRDRLMFLWFCLSFVLTLYSITGITTPILGTLVRYRMPALPFFVVAFFMMTNTKRLIHTVKRLYGYA